MIKQQLQSLSYFAAASVFTLGSSFAIADVIKIGVLAPLTGATAADGIEYQRGVEWAIEEINAAGGIAGNTFEMQVADVKDHSAANVSAAVERLLGTDDVEVILTGYASLSMFEVDLMAEANMPYIAAGPSAGFASIVSQDPEYYNCCWSYAASFKSYETDVLPAIQKMVKQSGITLRDKSIAVISSDNPYSKTIAEGLKKSFTNANWKVVVDEIVPTGEISDWRVILSKVNKSNPDLIVNTDYLPGNAALFIKQFLEKPTDSLVFLQYAPSVSEFRELTGAQSNGVLYNAIGGSLDTDKWPRGQQLMQTYQKRYNQESGAYGVGLYEMTQFYFNALKTVKDPKNHKAIGEALGKTKAQTVAGIIEFDPKTHLAIQDENHIPVSFWQLQEGKQVIIGPDKYSSGTFQIPHWKVNK